MLTRYLFLIALYFGVNSAGKYTALKFIKFLMLWFYLDLDVTLNDDQTSYNQTTALPFNATDITELSEGNENATTSVKIVTDEVLSSKELTTKIPVTEVSIKVTGTEQPSTDVVNTNADTSIEKNYTQPIAPLKENSTQNTNITNIEDKLSKLDYNEVENPFSVEDTDTNEDPIIVESKSYNRVAVIQGQLAVILAGVFVAVAIVGYVAMLSRRRYLE